MTKPTKLELPPGLLAAVTNQTAVLFLGAGASIDAPHPSNEKMPSGDDLRDELANKFLGGRLKNRSLSHVAELSISQTDLYTVQNFIGEKFRGFEPTKHHRLIPTFFWHGIVSTNYDLIVEKAYNLQEERKQEVVPFLKDGQRIESELKKKLNGVPYLKIHGCINHIDDPSIPLILSTEQYVRYLSNRKRLFNQLQGWGYEFPIIFCGYSLSDPHIQTILFDLYDEGINRPRYYLVSPGIDDLEESYWASHRITCIKASFSDFLNTLDNAVGREQRTLPAAIGGGTQSIRTFYKISGAAESDLLKGFLSDDADHVRPGLAIVGGKPSQFYLGYDTGWGPIEADLDVRRRVADNIIVDAILSDESELGDLVNLHVIKGPAGSGKSTTLSVRPGTLRVG